MTTPPPSSDAPARTRSLALRIALRIGLVVAVLLVALRIALPTIVARLGGDQASAALGRTVTIDDVSLGLWAGTLTLHDVRVGGAPGDAGADELLTCARAHVDLAWRDLLGGDLRLAELALDAPVLTLPREADGAFAPVVLAEPEPDAPEPDDGGLSFALDALTVRGLEVRVPSVVEPGTDAATFELEALGVGDLTLTPADLSVGSIEVRGPRLVVRRDFRTPPAAEPSAPEVADAQAAEGGGGLAPRVANVAVQDARFEVLIEDGPLDVSLDLVARDVALGPGERFHLELDLGIEDGRLTLEGDVGVSPPAFAGRLAWEALPIAPFARAAAGPIRIGSGATDGAIDFTTTAPEAGAPGAIRLSGRVGIREFAADGDAPPFEARWTSFDIDLEEIVLPLAAEGTAVAAPTVALGTVRLVGPTLQVTRVAADEPPPETLDLDPEEIEASPQPTVRVGEVALESGSVTLVDATLAPPFTRVFRALDFGARDIAWPERDVLRYRLTGRSGEGGRIAVSGSMRGGVGTTRAKIQDFALPPYSVYTAGGTGMRIASGRASVDSQIHVNGTRVDSENNVVLHELDVTELRDGAFQNLFGMRLDLGLALLRDHRGDIAIPVPVTLDSGEAGVRLTRIVVTALQRAIVSALTSPVRTLGAVVVAGAASDGGGLQPLDAEPGHDELDAESRERLPGVAALLGDRPALSLTLVGLADDVDDPYLAERWLVERIRAGEDLPDIEGVGFFDWRRIRRAIRDSDAIDFRDLERRDQGPLLGWAQTARVPSERRRALGRARADWVREALVGDHGLDAERVAVGKTVEGAPGVALGLSTGRGIGFETIRGISQKLLE